MSEESNPIIGYADSYRQMARTGTTSIDIWSIITDLERNMAPLMTSAQSELAALREELERVKAQSAQRLGGLAACGIKREAAEQRNAELVELLRDAAYAVKGHAMTAWAVPLYIRINKALSQPTESGESE